MSWKKHFIILGLLFSVGYILSLLIGNTGDCGSMMCAVGSAIMQFGLIILFINFSIISSFLVSKTMHKKIEFSYILGLYLASLVISAVIIPVEVSSLSLVLNYLGRI